MQNEFVMLNEVKHLHSFEILRYAQNNNLTFFAVPQFVIRNF